LDSIIFTFSACEKEEEEGDTQHPAKLVGTWDQIDAGIDFIITTNSSQTAFDIISEGVGGISVTGGHMAELTYMFGEVEEDSSVVVVVSTSSSFILEDELSFPFLTIFGMPSYYSFMGFFAVDVMEDTLTFRAEQGNYTFDQSSGSLTIPSTVLYNEEKTDSVIVSGSLAYQQIDVPAHTPTTIVSITAPAEVYGVTTVVLDEDGTFSRTTVYDDVETETSTGTWEVVGDGMMTVIETYIYEGETVTDTLDITFTVESGFLTIKFQEDACEDDSEWYIECLAYFENLFGLDSSSLTLTETKMILTFSKTTGNELAHPGGMRLWYNSKPFHRQIPEKMRSRTTIR